MSSNEIETMISKDGHILYPYFAFGSNMCREQMNDRLGELGVISEPIKVYAKGAKLEFDKTSSVSFPGSGVGNIVLRQPLMSMPQENAPQPIIINSRPDLIAEDSIVEGLLYYLNAAQMHELDKCEGVFSKKNNEYIDNKSGYKRCPIAVFNLDNKPITAIAYIANAALAQKAASDSKLWPTAPWLVYIQKFLKNNRLSTNYQKKLLKIKVFKGGIAGDYIDKNGDNLKELKSSAIGTFFHKFRFNVTPEITVTAPGSEIARAINL